MDNGAISIPSAFLINLLGIHNLSNPGPFTCKANALPLIYIPTCNNLYKGRLYTLHTPSTLCFVMSCSPVLL
jgi:hypothetical protein